MKNNQQRLAEIGRDIARRMHAEEMAKKKPGGGDDPGDEQREAQPGKQKTPKRRDEQR